jgi:hypothetical protein
MNAPSAERPSPFDCMGVAKFDARFADNLRRLDAAIFL